MPHNGRFANPSTALLVIVMVVLLGAPDAWAQSKYKTLYRFSGGKDGKSPQAGLIFDPAGNLYGTTSTGGTTKTNCSLGCGTVFKLTPNSNGSWNETVLHEFTWGEDGADPVGGLIFDAAGNLYGTTFLGGNPSGCDCGIVFELMPNQDGSWKEKILYQFMGAADGGNPSAGLVFDPAGNLYGVTFENAANAGAVFELTPNSDGSWTEKILYSFCSVKNCDDGGNPVAGLILDSAGALYGTTQHGGVGLSGVAFKLAPNSDGSWTETVLHAFKGGDDGLQPVAGLIFDPAGNLYGTTRYGGRPGGGVVFKLTPQSDGSWTEQRLHGFTGSNDGGNPYAAVVLDPAGNVYGTTQLGGLDPRCGFGCGVVFKLTPKSGGGWKFAKLHTFLNHPGAEPVAGLTFDAAGNLYGTTSGDGVTTFGSVFEITP
jgi:uncharacterized repeat protein (TIGR03803 family)